MTRIHTNKNATTISIHSLRFAGNFFLVKAAKPWPKLGHECTNSLQTSNSIISHSGDTGTGLFRHYALGESSRPGAGRRLSRRQHRRGTRPAPKPHHWHLQYRPWLV